MVTIKYRRLDKFRLLHRYLSLSSHQSFNETFVAAKNFAKFGDLKQKKEPHRTLFWKKYDGKSESTVLTFVFFSVNKKPALSIEIAPRKLSPDDWADAKALFTVLGLDSVWNTFQISSVEIVMDVRIPFNDLAYFSPGVTVSDPSYFAAGTYYIGAMTGHRHFRIYDKQKHLKEKKSKHIAYPLTRIEAIHQGLQLAMGDIHQIQNPFGRLIVFRKSALDNLRKKHPFDYEFGYFCCRISGGLPGHDAYWEQEPTARKRIAKLIRPYGLNLNGVGGTWNAWIAKQTAVLEQAFLD